MWGHIVPGLQYIVYVPPTLQKRAERILKKMPFDLEEETIRERLGIPDSNKRIFKVFIVGYMFFFVIPLLNSIGWEMLPVVFGIAVVVYLVRLVKEKNAQKNNNSLRH